MSQQIAALKKFATQAGVVDPKTIVQIEASVKPTVIMPGGAISITQSATDLYTHIAPSQRLFLRDGNVCRLTDNNGVQRLELVRKAEACSLFEEFVSFAKRGQNNQLKPEVLSSETADKYLTANAKHLLPVIDGLLSCPVITERGNRIHIVQSGYDPVTKLLIVKNVPLTDVPVTEAVESLKGLLQDFEFQTASDRSRAIASLITPALKFGGFIKGHIPADAAEADQSQAGKSYRQQMIAAVYNDTCAVVNKKEGAGVGSLEEAFSTALVEGRPFIQFDNVRGKFSFQALESFMTTVGTFAARPAYSGAIHIIPSKFMIMVSSNGYQTTPDLSNRSSIIRINKRPGYKFLTWAPNGNYRGGMREFIEDNQGYILSCVFSIIKEWHRRGKPRTSESRHDFREWCQVLDWIVQSIFKEAPLMDGHQAAQARVTSPDHTFLRQLALGLSQRNQMNCPLRARDLFTACDELGLYIPGVSAEKRHDERDVTIAIGKLMKRVFGESASVEVDVYTLTRCTQRVTGGSVTTFPSNVYSFRKTADPEETAGSSVGADGADHSETFEPSPS